ncbi:2-hydroxychromene-2-carboxylate isomerase [Shimia abyssi]|uniref:2-hydroxychromene-2-carboxylate isomerase n=1 Tax=Shimia abyssi TaxID=1662395 RepID=A0A2P8FJD7_9RHOB|nr:DsbA family protein [Shimia abyssi]PSL21820.1 2-hydroxychromene-2-carboxylate isomerase [Shimia abyssi]
MSDAPLPEIDFWFSIGSTYTYLSVMRLPDLAAKTGITFNWRPFSVRAIMIEQKNIPFVGKPARTAHMWRDIARRAPYYGLSPKIPAPYPLENFDLTNQVAILAAQEGWVQDYTRATYQRWFEHGEPAGSDPNLSTSLNAIGQDPARVIPAAQTEFCLSAYTQATNQARDLGIFGAPSFIVGSELFWGDDRIEDAVDWAYAQQAVS